MKTFTDLQEWREFRRQLDCASLGFVPTMGSLHDGHRELVERSLTENAVTVVSVFLNPTQFDNHSDLASYPAALNDDLAMLKSMGVQAVLMPTPDAMYPDQYRYRVSESELSRQYCGAHRAGHFDGVLTVVMRLLNLVRADRVYFGEKDYQQLQLVRGMIEAFFMDGEIVACPTVREPDGLAMSSRNARLDTEARRLAPRLYHALNQPGDAILAKRRLRAEGFTVDYVGDLGNRRLAAVRLGEVRLIDNVALDGLADE